MKKRVANIFRRRDSSSNDSWGTSTQTIINQTEQEEDTESCNSNENSVHSDWSELLQTERNVQYKQCNAVPSTSTAGATTNQSNKTPVKRTTKNIVLVPYKPKPGEWGSWRIKSPYVTSTIASPNENGEQEKGTDEITYVPHSPYYSPVHPPQFYKDE